MSPDMHDDLDRLHDDLAGYALGALDRDETARLEAHLESCDSCRERLRWLYPAVDVLPAAVEQVSPPDTLRESLMAAITAESEGAAVAGPAAESTESPARPAHRSRWAALGGLMLRPAAGFAAVILLAAGVATGYIVRGSDDQPAPQSTFIEGKGAQGVTGVSATLERHGDSGTLHVNQLPALDRDQVYAVWVQRAGVMEPASTFILGRDGSAEAAVPGPLEGAEGVFVTAEPRPGSPRPTSPAVLEAPLR